MGTNWPTTTYPDARAARFPRDVPRRDAWDLRDKVLPSAESTGLRPVGRRQSEVRVVGRVVLVLVTILALTATSITVWAARSIASPVTEASGETREHRDSATTVGRFYAAVTEGLQTGRTNSLNNVIAPNFTIHSPEFPDAVGLTAFDQVLLNLRNACPKCVVSVDSVVVDADVASVMVTGRTDGLSSVVGLPINGELVAWTAQDHLRIEEGRIAEYWNRVSPLVAPNSIGGELFLTMPKTGLAQVGLTHLSLQPGAHTGQADTTIARHIVVESGLLTVSTERAPSAEQVPKTTFVPHLDAVKAGEHIVIPANVGLDLGNDGTEPVSVWVIAIRPSVVNVDEDSSWLKVESETGDQPAGVRQRVVAATIVSGSPGSQCTLEIARLMLAPGASIGDHTVEGTELLSVGSGELTVVVAGGRARIVHGQEPEARDHLESEGSGVQWQDPAVLTALDTAVLNGGHVDVVRNTGAAPVDLIALVVTPSIPNQSASSGSAPADSPKHMEIGQ
jgi:predicted ester cyclase